MSLKSGGQNFTSKDVFFSILVHLMAMSREKEEYAIMIFLMFYLYKHHYHIQALESFISKKTDYQLDLLWSIALY